VVPHGGSPGERGILKDSIQHISESAVKGAGLFPANSIIVATSATIGEHALITVPHLSNQRFTSLTLKAELASQLDMKFVYYYCFVLDEWCRNNTTTSSFASVDMAGFRKFRFPVPPLEVQREIVRILDAFTQLDAALEAELAARRHQYQHYSRTMLESGNFAPKVVHLGDVADILVGFPFKSSEFSNDRAKTALVRGDNIGQGFLKDADFKRWMRVSDDAFEKYELRAEDIVLAMDRPWIPAGLKWSRVTEDVLPALLVQRVARLRSDAKVLDQHFLGCIISSPAFTEYVLRNQTGNTVPHISGRQIESFEFSLPPLPEQIRIATVLGKFETLTNDLSIGLPAEIAARRKQYEYYRDHLLTFKELAA
jgi:type I restriction enzyme, S subunit